MITRWLLTPSLETRALAWIPDSVPSGFLFPHRQLCLRPLSGSSSSPPLHGTVPPGAVPYVSALFRLRPLPRPPHRLRGSEALSVPTIPGPFCSHLLISEYNCPRWAPNSRVYRCLMHNVCQTIFIYFFPKSGRIAPHPFSPPFFRAQTFALLFGSKPRRLSQLPPLSFTPCRE